MESFIHKLNAHIEAILVQRKINFSVRDFDDFHAAYVRNKNTATGVPLKADIQRGLYLACRMPATVAAAHRVLSELPHDFYPRTQCDLGSGTGSAIVAAAARFPTLSQVTAIDANAQLLAMGEEILTRMTPALRRESIVESYGVGNVMTRADLVTLSYTLNEIPENQRLSVVANAWSHCTGFLVVVEPGSKAGFATIMQIRDWALAQGIYVYAPCSHQGVCPLRERDWCHFHTRFTRSKRLLQVKRGSRGYEDEPYSYLILSRLPVDRGGQRILSAPTKIPYGLKVSLCAPDTAEEKIYAKKDEQYKRLKHMNAGAKI